MQRCELAVDFVVHGDRGVAGPWAAARATDAGQATRLRAPAARRVVDGATSSARSEDPLEPPSFLRG